MGGQPFQLCGLDQLGQHHLKFVAADAPDGAALSDHSLQAIGHLHEQAVAGRMPQRIVHLLEPVEIEEEQRARLRPAEMTLERLFQQPVDLQPIGSPVSVS